MKHKTRETTKKRKERVFEVYQEVIKKHGAYAPRLQKSELYEEVAELVNYSAKTVSCIIQEHLRSERSKA